MARELRVKWRQLCGTEPPARLSCDLLIRAVAHKMQERAHGGLAQSTRRKIRILGRQLDTEGNAAFDPGLALKTGAKLVREWHGRTHTVIVLEDGFDYDGRRYRSLSKIAREITGAHWSGPRFFGVRQSSKPFSERREVGHE